MYENLKKINLTKYLDKCCGNSQRIEESWLLSLDLYVGTLSEENINILKSKIKNNLDHYQINDIIHEIMVACAYHPEANFIKEGQEKSYDLFDPNLDLKIEVKTLNEGDDEKERHKEDKCDYNSPALTHEEKQDIVKKIKTIICKKCVDHFEKAINQIGYKGKIYLIYDCNLLITKNPNSATKNKAPFSKNDIKNIIKNCTNEFLKNNLDVLIEIIYIEKLREQVAAYR